MLSRLSLIIIAQIADTLPFLQLRHTPPGYATQRWLLGYDPLYLACEGRVVAVVVPRNRSIGLSYLSKNLYYFDTLFQPVDAIDRFCECDE
jgi:hypothetical protein